MARTGRTFTEYLKDYLSRITPEERAMFDEASEHFAEEAETLRRSLADLNAGRITPFDPRSR